MQECERLILVLLSSALFLCRVHATVRRSLAIERFTTRVYSDTGMVAAQNRMPSEIGAQILADGGNAVDAAVAVGFALAVTLPRAGNIGGGGFMLVYDAESGRQRQSIIVKWRRWVRLATCSWMRGQCRPKLVSRFSPCIGRAGHGRRSVSCTSGIRSSALEQSAATGDRLARDGIVVTHDLATQLKNAQRGSAEMQTTCAYFYKPGGVPYEMGERLVQTDLADTLQLIADEGPDAFYKGAIAEKIVAEMETGDGSDRYGVAGCVQAGDSRAAARQLPRLRNRCDAADQFGRCTRLQMLNILETFSDVRNWAREAPTPFTYWRK